MLRQTYPNLILRLSVWARHTSEATATLRVQGQEKEEAMITLTAPVKPVTGRIERACLACGQGYTGWHLYLCRDCESLRTYKIIETWH